MRQTATEALLAAQRRVAPAIDGRIANAAPVRARPRGDLATAATRPVLTVDFPGRLTVKSSDRWYAPADLTLRELALSVSSVATTETVLTVYRDGVSSGTLVLPAGQSLVVAPFPLAVPKNTHLVFAITTPGSGASGAIAQARF